MRAFALLAGCALLALAAPACDDDTNTGTSDTSTETADTSDTADTALPPDFCEGTTEFDYDPAAGSLAAFPDDYMTVDDDTTGSGLRVSIADDAPIVTEAPALFQTNVLDLNALDGWGTSAGIILRFSGALGEIASGDASLLQDTVQLVALDGEAARRIPFEIELLDDGTTIILTPMVPLAPSTLHGVVITRDQLAADGDCVRPSDPLRQVLLGTATEPRLVRVGTRYQELLQKTGLAADDVSAAIVFTTQTIHDASLAALAFIKSQRYHWLEGPTCTDAATFKRCLGTVAIFDFRVEGELSATVTPVQYNLPVHIWLPLGLDAPADVLIFGHGLGGSADQAQGIVPFAVAADMAVVAISAPRQGDHPTRRFGDANAPFLDLFGLDLGAFQLASFAFRENLRQAGFDKLQVISLLAGNGDVDGDMTQDLDVEKLAYWGASLGGIMGADLLALSDRVDVGVLTVAGGTLFNFILDGADFEQVRGFLEPLAGGRDALRQIGPVAQTLIDAGDPVNYARHVLRDRLVAGPPPQVLQQMVIGDTTVPNSTNRALARALGVTHLAPFFQDVGVIERAETAPLSANVEGVTGGLFQFDRVTPLSGGSVRKATHNNVFQSIEGPSQVFSFIQTGLDTGTSLMADPYADLGTPSL